MPKEPTLAIVEDNLDLQEELRFFLESKGYACWFANSAEEFWKKLHLQKADIFLIDIGLPGEDGFSLINHLGKLGSFGLIIMTARGGKQDYLKGLHLGADHYLVKPVNLADLDNKLEFLWQRLQLTAPDNTLEANAEVAVNSTFEANNRWVLDKINFCLWSPNENKLDLTQQEKELLDLLIKQPNQILSRDFINQSLFHHLDNDDVHRVDVVVSRLRKKAKTQDFYLPLRSIFGKGLVFLVDE